MSEQSTAGKSGLDVEEIASELEDAQASPAQFELITYPADFTLEVLADKYAKGEIAVPAMQREFVWKVQQASKLIDSFLLGLPVPPIYLYAEKGSETLLVVDGQQRLRSIAFYLSGFFGDEEKGKKAVFRLKVGTSSRYEGKAFAELEDEDQRRLKNSVLRSFVMRQVNPDDDSSLIHVFERLNTGGTLLTVQEVRNAIYNGEFSAMLREVNDIVEWRKILGNPTPDSRAQDVELVLRFFALKYNLKAYKKPMKEFLSKFMKGQRAGRNNILFRDSFITTSQTVLRCLGEKPFHSKTGINPSRYDAAFIAFSENLEKIPGDIQKRFSMLKEDNDFTTWSSNGTTDPETISKRIDRARTLLFG